MNEKIKNNRFYIILFVIIIPLGAGIGKYFDLYCKIFDCEECTNEITLVKNHKISYNAIQKLKELERRNVPNFSLEKDKRFDKLIDYYVDSNDDEMFDPKSFMKLNLIIAPAGSGKSMIYRKIKDLVNPQDANIQKISLDDICDCKNSPCTSYLSNRPQLYNRSSSWDKNFCELPYSNTLQLSDLLSENDVKFDSLKANYLFIDACDEWHPQTIDKLLEQIYKYSNDSSNNWKFILLGRPEGFRYFISKTDKIPFSEYKRFYLKSPEYITEGDIMLRIKDCKKYVAPHIDTKTVFERIISKKGDIRDLILSELQNLQGGNYLIEEYHEKDISDIEELKRNIYLAYIGRNEGTHCRPGIDDDLYYHLLRQTALKYHELDTDGYFRVGATNLSKLYICIGEDEKLVSVNEQDLLEFSGLINIKPISGLHTEFSFYPIWVHRFLIENKENPQLLSGG